MKKAVSTPCVLTLIFGLYGWMGIAMGWDGQIILALILCTVFCCGLMLGQLAFDLWCRLRIGKRR